MMMQRLECRTATSLLWLKSCEERDIDADAREDDRCSQTRREVKKCGSRIGGSTSLFIGGQGRNAEIKAGAGANQ